MSQGGAGSVAHLSSRPAIVQSGGLSVSGGNDTPLKGAGCPVMTDAKSSSSDLLPSRRNSGVLAPSADRTLRAAGAEAAILYLNLREWAAKKGLDLNEFDDHTHLRIRGGGEGGGRIMTSKSLGSSLAISSSVASRLHQQQQDHSFNVSNENTNNRDANTSKATSSSNSNSAAKALGRSSTTRNFSSTVHRSASNVAPENVSSTCRQKQERHENKESPLEIKIEIADESHQKSSLGTPEIQVPRKLSPPAKNGNDNSSPTAIVGTIQADSSKT
eukprot:CAMPEP_0185252628 /NCGR_PEP_ID=MMETSP1359-20130426/1661_1 /TAXON_ID=552665 /ORGANISM="Bigelowiella longifila, Strain CCMP242" /LENGTH=272 /DNA_ID=CAMNT_0027834849 /DNA_START=128 /DNA_END=946 /DNA_ORIENTATION=-